MPDANDYDKSKDKNKSNEYERDLRLEGTIISSDVWGRKSNGKKN